MKEETETGTRGTGDRDHMTGIHRTDTQGIGGDMGGAVTDFMDKDKEDTEITRYAVHE